MDCISPCPTGSIDNWRVVQSPIRSRSSFPGSELPPQEELAERGVGAQASAGGSAVDEALEAEVDALIADGAARSGRQGGRAASRRDKPTVNLLQPRRNRRSRPSPAISGCTDADADNDVRHIILDFGDVPFPVLEGQSIGIVAAGRGRRTASRIHPRSIRSRARAMASDPNTNNLALDGQARARAACARTIFAICSAAPRSR